MQGNSKDSECPECHGTEWILSEDENGCTQARPCKCRERNQMSRRIKFAEIPEAYKGMGLKNFSLSVYQTISGRNAVSAACRTIKKYLDGFHDAYSEGLGLYLYSETKGSGKTRMAASIANELVKQYPVKFAVSTEILNEIRKTYDRESGMTESRVLDALVEVDILFIDDFGAENMTGWVNDKFYHIVNERYINKKVTFFTSNEAVENLKYDGRIKSRVQERTYQVPFPEESVRAAQAAERNRRIIGCD